jgi:outer membrane protein OmpA-like peptidoglycan-associated protein
MRAVLSDPKNGTPSAAPATDRIGCMPNLRQLTRNEGFWAPAGSAPGRSAPGDYPMPRRDVQYAAVLDAALDVKTPWRERQAERAKKQYLPYVLLDEFDWNKHTLTPRLKEKVKELAELVRLSWTTVLPIGFIRLVGHTDNTGDEEFNKGLGDRRAEAVKAALEEVLKEDIISKRTPIAILIDKSPGKASPRADNRTGKGMALNRRVEVYVTLPDPAPEKPAKPAGPDIKEEIKKAFEEIEKKAAERGYNKPIPTLPQGKSFKQFVNDFLRDRGVPDFIRTQIWGAIFDKDYNSIDSLLGMAGVDGPAAKSFIGVLRGLAEVKVK